MTHDPELHAAKNAGNQCGGTLTSRGHGGATTALQPRIAELDGEIESRLQILRHPEISVQRPDWLADEAVGFGPVPTSNSLLTGKITGNFRPYVAKEARPPLSLLKNLSGPGIGLPMKIAADDF